MSHTLMWMLTNHIFVFYRTAIIHYGRCERIRRNRPNSSDRSRSLFNSTDYSAFLTAPDRDQVVRYFSFQPWRICLRWRRKSREKSWRKHSFSFSSCSSSGLPLHKNQNENQRMVDVIIDSQDCFPAIHDCNDKDFSNLNRNNRINSRASYMSYWNRTSRSFLQEAVISIKHCPFLCLSLAVHCRKNTKSLMFSIFGLAIMRGRNRFPPLRGVERNARLGNSRTSRGAGVNQSRARQRLHGIRRPIIRVALFIFALYLILLYVMHTKTWKTIRLPDLAQIFSKVTPLQSKHTRDRSYQPILCCFSQIVPQYLLFSLKAIAGKRCKPMFQSIIPILGITTETNDALIEFLFEYTERCEYSAGSFADPTKKMPKMRGKFCLNASYEWLLFTTLENSKVS